MGLIEQVQQYLTIAPETNLADLAYTLSQRDRRSHCLAIIAKDIADLQQKLALAVDKIKSTWKTKLQLRGGVYYAENQVDPGQTVFLFSTEGSQYPNMLADVCCYFPQVRDWFDFLDETFPRENPPSSLIFPPPTSLTPEEKQWAADQLYAGDLATEALFAASMGLYELLRDFGINCHFVVGHSAGEHTAASALGISRVKSRTQMMEHLRHLNQIYRNWEANYSIPTGVLMSVGAVEYDFVQQLIESFSSSVYLVADNCPSQLLLFAKQEVSEEVTHQIQQAGGICVPQPFDRAYHTPLFDEVGEALRAHYNLLEIDGKPKQICLYSCATTEPYPEQPEAIRTLALQQWSLPVRFRETIEKLYNRGVRTFIEVGAGSNLTAFVDDILKGRDYLTIASNNQRQTGLKSIQQLLAKLFINGREFNLAPLYKQREVRELNLDAPVASQPKPAPTLNLLLPRMSLKPEFVEQIREKLTPTYPSSHSDSLVANLKPEVTNSSSESNPTPVISNPKSPQVTPNLNSAQVEKEESFQEAAEYPTPQPSNSESCRLAILQGHFELMEEFLANQGRVTDMFS